MSSLTADEGKQRLLKKQKKISLPEDVGYIMMGRYDVTCVTALISTSLS